MRKHKYQNLIPSRKNCSKIISTTRSFVCI